MAIIKPTPNVVYPSCLYNIYADVYRDPLLNISHVSSYNNDLITLL